MKKLKPFLPLLIVVGVVYLTATGTLNVPLLAGAVVTQLGLTLRDGLAFGLGALLMAVLRGR